MSLSFHDKFSRQFSAPHNSRHREKLKFTLSLFMVAAVLTGSIIFKQTWNSFNEKPTSDSKNSAQFTLYSSKDKNQTPWKFRFSNHHHKWIMVGKDHSPRFILNGLYLQNETEVPRYFRYWVSQKTLTENGGKREQTQSSPSPKSFQSRTIYLSDRPKGVLLQDENPIEHIVAVTFERKDGQLKMAASPLDGENKTKSWKVLSWRIKKSDGFQTHEKKAYPSGQKLVLRVPSEKSHHSPVRAVSSH